MKYSPYGMHWVNLVKESGRTGFPRAGKAASLDFPQASPSGNPYEQPCQSLENPVVPYPFTQTNPVHSMGAIFHSILPKANI